MIRLIGSGSTIAQELEADNFEHISQVRSVILQITSSNFFFLLLGIIVIVMCGFKSEIFRPSIGRISLSTTPQSINTFAD